MADTDTLEVNLLNRINDKKTLLNSLRPLPDSTLLRYKENMRAMHTYNSNAIEGNTLTLQETRLIIDEGITIGGKPLREHMEAVGNAEAYDIMENIAYGAGITHETIQLIHRLVTKGQQLDSGQYRMVNVRITGASKQPPDWKKIIVQMDECIKLAGKRTQQPCLHAAHIHHRFLEIHPFSDGNGRVGRIILNIYLIQKGYPPVILHKEDCQKYYQHLQKADNGNLSPLKKFILKAIDESLTLYLSMMGGENELKPLREIATETQYTQEYLSLRARQGKLDAVKIDNIWHTTQKAIREYVETNKKQKPR